jgi:hypothetical protein
VDWYAGQRADAPKPGKFRKQAAETAGFLLDAWGTREYLPKEGNTVLALPDWVPWCADRAGLPAALAVALKAARAEAANSVTDDHGPGDEDGDGAPFRRKEL